MTTIRFDDDLREGLKEVAQRDGILIPEQVRRAVRAWLEAKGVLPKDKSRKQPSKRSS